MNSFQTRLRAAATLLVLASFAPGLSLADSSPVDARAALEMLKKMSGDWTGTVTKPDGPPAKVIYRTTAHGNAVMETLFPGTDHEMISMYHLDGKDLVMTHYCAMGNQPRMRLASAKPGELVFEFAGGSNLDPSKDTHMHSGKIIFLEGGRVEAEWAVYEGEKQVGVNKFFLARARN